MRRDKRKNLSVQYFMMLSTFPSLGIMSTCPVHADKMDDDIGNLCTKTGTIELSVEYVSGTALAFSYVTPNGNQPSEYENHIYLWSVSENAVPWSRPAQNAVPVLANTPSGDQVISPVNITGGAYILAYSAGPETKTQPWSEYGNVSSYTYIPQDHALTQSLDETSRIGVSYIGQQSLIYSYDFLSGFRPEDAGSWVGIWEGEQPSYTISPQWQGPIKQNDNSGELGLNGLSLKRDQNYTIGLFANGAASWDDEKSLQSLVAFCVFQAQREKP